ncbi:DUF523 domain-containing protein [archaeon]|jgi:uncharacterized protein YbbK (DUF523 family)|nr:DUF523 domain-containing protein [archaeon]MBT4351616.1 DUF523 domain-containing protein [archaeon]MBT4646682.1 DUF523 domain-containing protein [archaeon]MBT6821868.1 DUF523 domain-containing protein [archaeon]MBT7392278.1 DUF523 domain-containing protein [archaeon]
MIIVSACLIGINCAFDGRSRPNRKVLGLMRTGKLIPICPEQLGGLPTPRDSADQIGDKVITRNGKDVTAQYVLGAKEGLFIAQLTGCKKAILKARSPSCGPKQIYDKTCPTSLIKDYGVFAKLLKENNIEVLSEDDL